MITFLSQSTTMSDGVVQTHSHIYFGKVNEQVPRYVTDVIIHDSVRTIKRYAFKDCSSLERVFMNENVTRIEFGAFYYCTSLRNIVLPRNLEHIGYYAFHFCESLRSVTIPDIMHSRIYTIGDFAFAFCTSLRHFEFSPALEHIGNSAFCRCSSLEAIFLPASLERIGKRAFRGCESLRFLNIPETVIELRENVVHECNKFLTEIEYIRDKNTWQLTNDDEVNEWIRRLHDEYPLHRECFKIDVTISAIQDCIDQHGEGHAIKSNDQGMTPLHILCSNPRVTDKALKACCVTNPDAAYMADIEGSTPIHFLCRYNPSMVSNFISYEGLSDCLRTANYEGVTPIQILADNNDLDQIDITVAIKQHIKWQEGMNTIFQATKASKIQRLMEKDAASGLHLFMLSAVGNFSDLNTIFELIRIQPDLALLHI